MKLKHIFCSFFVLRSIMASTFLNTVANPMNFGLNFTNTELRQKVLSFKCVCKQMLQCKNTANLLQVVLSSLNKITRFSRLNLQKNRDDCITFSTIKDAIQSAHTEFTIKLGELKKAMASSELDESKKAEIEGDIGVLEKIVSYLTYYIAKQDEIEKSPTRPDFENKLLMQEILKLNSLYDEIVNEDDSAELQNELQLFIKTIINRFVSSINAHNSSGYINSKDKSTFLWIQNELKLATTMLCWKLTEFQSAMDAETDPLKKSEIKRKIDSFWPIVFYSQNIYYRFKLLEEYPTSKIFQ